jgi:hypothetical protein
MNPIPDAVSSTRKQNADDVILQIFIPLWLTPHYEFIKMDKKTT